MLVASAAADEPKDVAVPAAPPVALRISQGYAAASRAESAKRIELQAEGLQVAAEAKVAFFNWVRAKGASVVAEEAVTQADAHLVDVRRVVEAGLASKRAEANIESSDRGLVAAEETLRVQTELLRAGRATSVTIVDAEAEVTRARLRRVDARVSILVAKTRLEHATGRDVPAS